MSNAFGKLLREFSDWVERRNRSRSPEPPSGTANWKAKNHHEHIVLYQADEPVAKIRPEDADEIVGALSLTLEKRRMGDE